MAAKRVRTAPKIGYSALGPHRAMSLPAKAPGCRCWFKSGARNDLPASVPEPLSHIGGPPRSLFASLPRAMLSAPTGSARWRPGFEVSQEPAREPREHEVGVLLCTQGDGQLSRLPNLTRSSLLLGVLLAGVLVGAGAATALEIGEKAPDFTLPGTTGEKISLSQFRGNKLVLIEFYVGESPT